MSDSSVLVNFNEARMRSKICCGRCWEGAKQQAAAEGSGVCFYTCHDDTETVIFFEFGQIRNVVPVAEICHLLPKVVSHAMVVEIARRHCLDGRQPGWCEHDCARVLA